MNDDGVIETQGVVDNVLLVRKVLVRVAGVG